MVFINITLDEIISPSDNEVETIIHIAIEILII